MSGEFKDTESTGKYLSSRYDYDLYNEEDNKKMPMVRIQRHYVKKTSEEKWKFYENTKKIMEIDSLELTDKEKDFLRTPNGILFCLKKYKEKKDIEFIKSSLKEHIEKG